MNKYRFIQSLVEQRVLRVYLKDRVKNKYQKLDEITDLSGIRVITYYTDTVDQISKLIENEFIIDRDNSIDKRKSLDQNVWVSFVALCGSN